MSGSGQPTDGVIVAAFKAARQMATSDEAELSVYRRVLDHAADSTDEEAGAGALLAVQVVAGSDDLELTVGG